MGKRARKKSGIVGVEQVSSPPEGSADCFEQKWRAACRVPEPRTPTEKINQARAWHEHVCDRADLSNAWRYSWRAAWMKALGETATNLGFVPGSEGYGGRGDFEQELRAYWEGTRAPSQTLPSATTTAVREMPRKQLEALALKLLDAGWWHARHDMLERRESAEQSVEVALSLASYGLRRKRAAEAARWVPIETSEGKHYVLSQAVEWTPGCGAWYDERRDDIGSLLAHCLPELGADRDKLNRSVRALAAGGQGRRFDDKGKVMRVVRGLVLMGDPCWGGNSDGSALRPVAASQWLEKSWGMKVSRETLAALLRSKRRMLKGDEPVVQRIVEWIARECAVAARHRPGSRDPRAYMKGYLQRSRLSLRKVVWESAWLAEALGETSTTAP